ncbi:hypothetical protein CKAH01_02167 [Colletotrichum kahawae]|uniref:Uncharacterized protein n=1 Tax=Colletotrichum kahawae TaxID=34407 RepID=A0AAD9Y2E8_COLKA|nr:hypothetical protein CKAH01_02167 [Colletotrichum kahawae]
MVTGEDSSHSLEGKKSVDDLIRNRRGASRTDEKPKPPSKDTTTTESPQLAFGNGNDAHIHGRASFLSLLLLLLLVLSTEREKEREKDGREFYHSASPFYELDSQAKRASFGMLQGSDGRPGFGHLRRQTNSCYTSLLSLGFSPFSPHFLCFCTATAREGVSELVSMILTRFTMVYLYWGSLRTIGSAVCYYYYSVCERAC